MGVWTENLSLPAVLNECMMQSYSGAIRLFPNTQNLGPARFHNLRAAGAFLVSAAWDGQRVGAVEFLSERGVTARMVNPWPGAAVKVIALNSSEIIGHNTSADLIEFKTKAGTRYRITS
jgi:alpha-L-fucosidase 2